MRHGIVRFQTEHSMVGIYGSVKIFFTLENDSNVEASRFMIRLAAKSLTILLKGLRMDFHVGQLTMDFGRRRLVARNRFRNTTNAFDDVHGHLARGKPWRLRAFLVHPVAGETKGVRDIFGADDTVFWGVYYET